MVGQWCDELAIAPTIYVETEINFQFLVFIEINIRRSSVWRRAFTIAA
jgi:hypothetical protein